MTAETDSYMTYGEPLIYPAYPEGYYERAEGSNYRNYGDDEGWETILRVLGEPGSKHRTILEVGCAKGYFVKHARERGYEARGFDISEYAIAKSVDPDHTWVASAADPWLAGTETYDMVVSWETFEHIYEQDVPYVLREAHRVLRPGGRLIAKIGGLTDDDGDHDATHFTKKGREWWATQMLRAGFSVRADDQDLLDALDEAFVGRDWRGRFFVVRKTNTPWPR